MIAIRDSLSPFRQPLAEGIDQREFVTLLLLQQQEGDEGCGCA
jgi:hypothetical protein